MESREVIDVDGLQLDCSFIPEYVRSAMKYEPKDGEVIVSSFPKCGTTWMCQIVLLILRRGELLTTKEDYFSSCPFLEVYGADAASKMMPNKGCIKTHLPFDRITFSKQAKYIFVTRHPRDCAVSYFHHYKLFPVYRFSKATFDNFFDLFVNGKTDYNDFFDCLLSWYSHREEPNILIVTYEEMKANHQGTVLKVARFLGEEHVSRLTEKDSELLNHIVRYSSFDYMKTVINDIFKEEFLQPDPWADDELAKLMAKCMENAVKDGHQSVGEFVRKGTVGEGRTMLSLEQEQRLQKRILEKTAGTDAMSLWPEQTDEQNELPQLDA